MMKPTILILLIVFNFVLINSSGQNIVANTCDSSLLTKSAYEKCKTDTAWTADLIIKTNYIIQFKTALVPKYRVIRRALIIPATLQESLLQLKRIYDTVLNKKLNSLETEMDKNQQYVQPNAYLSSLLSFQLFRFYPDIYAVLLNDIHLSLTPKTSFAEQKQYTQLVEQTFRLIPADLYQQLLQLTSEFNIETNALMQQGVIKPFQGAVLESKKIEYDVINFLLWTN